MTIITKEDLIQSIQDSLQYISYYHPPDFIRAVAEAYEREESPAARDAMAQILSRTMRSAQNVSRKAIGYIARRAVVTAIPQLQTAGEAKIHLAGKASW